MKRLLIPALPFLCAQLASAQSAVPGAISYQGRVADAAGVLIGDAAPVNRKVTLRIYDQATATTPLYAEEQTVTVNKGVFSVLLGQGLQSGGDPRPAIASVFNGAERFLGVTVDDGGPAADPEITPRQQIVSTAYAFRARTAELATSVNQQSGESVFNITHANLSYMNGPLVMNGDSQIHLGGGGGDANGYLFSNAGGVGLYGRGPTDAERRLHISAKGGTFIDGALDFGHRRAQHINLWGNTFGFGIQDGTLYSRTADQFAWYQGGVHADGAVDSGGGQNLAVLNGSGLSVHAGGVHVNAGGVHVNAGGVSINSGHIHMNNGALTNHNGHGVFSQSFGGDHAFGSQDFTTYSRTARSFAWYLRGGFAGGELDPGGGTTMAVLNDAGLNVTGGLVAGGTGRVNGNFTIGGDTLQIGANIPGQEGSAGRIAYNGFGFNGLSIVGGGTSGNNRRVKVWAEAGTTFTGAINLDAAQRFPAGYGLGSNSDTFTADGVVNTNNQNASDVVLSALDGRVVAARFTAVSDARIKKVTGVSNAADDLVTLMKVQVTDYTHKDDNSGKPRQNKKVIAQQVEKVFPQAVDTTAGPVPDLLTGVTAKAGFIKLDKALPVAVTKGDVLKAWAKDPQAGGTGAMLVTVTGTTKEGFQLEQKLDGKVFLYGHQVNDLRSVDYEAISMLNVSATQEMNRTIQAQAAEIKALTGAKAVLEKELAAAKEANTLQDTRLASIEKALELKVPATAPSKKETKVASRR